MRKENNYPFIPLEVTLYYHSFKRVAERNKTFANAQRLSRASFVLKSFQNGTGNEEILPILRNEMPKLYPR